MLICSAAGSYVVDAGLILQLTIAAMTFFTLLAVTIIAVIICRRSATASSEYGLLSISINSQTIEQLVEDFDQTLSNVFYVTKSPCASLFATRRATWVTILFASRRHNRQLTVISHLSDRNYISRLHFTNIYSFQNYKLYYTFTGCFRLRSLSWFSNEAFWW